MTSTTGPAMHPSPGGTPDDGRPRRTVPVPGYGVLLGTVAAICTGGMALNLLAAIALGVVDEGPRTLEQQLVGVLGFGAAGLVACVLLAHWLGSTPRRRRVGAIALGALAVPCLVFFFSGLPGILGATSAHLAGFTRGRTLLVGAPRVVGLVGLVIAALNVLVVVVGVSVAWLTEIG